MSQASPTPQAQQTSSSRPSQNGTIPSPPARVPVSYTFFKAQVGADNVAAINSRGVVVVAAGSAGGAA